MNAEILKSYTGNRNSLPALVLVNHDKVGSILMSLCSPTMLLLLVQIALIISSPSKGWLKRYNFVACDKLTASLRHGMFRLSFTNGKCDEFESS